tara:strand:+ start:4122 stop:4592 length:471 start_codon:yes stop_codon:yes gene_type:complete
MASVNRVIVLGNLGRDPEIRYTSDERAIANLSLATSSRYKDKGSGELKEQTEWHKIVLYNRLAEVAREYLKKGQSVYVEGRLQTRKWQDQNGQDRYTTEIVGDNMQMLGSRSGSNGESLGNTKTNESGPNPITGNSKAGDSPVAKGFEDLDDDIPF